MTKANTGCLRLILSALKNESKNGMGERMRVNSDKDSRGE